MLRAISILQVTLMQSHRLASKDPSHKFPLEGCDIAMVSEETLISLVDTAPVLHRFAGTTIPIVANFSFESRSQRLAL